ncbi:MAG: hypothetical protein KGH75_09320 [Rhodospirillales bacterium]|nr:hypothetical protein [Rhodospirillales bacterium]
MKFLADLWGVLKGAGLRLDHDEASALGAPWGETISIWTAMEARHGSALAHAACLALYLVQWRHCRDQLAGVPMQAGNYVRAMVLLMLFAPVAALVWTIRECAKPAALIVLAVSVGGLAAAFMLLAGAKSAAGLIYLFSR